MMMKKKSLVIVTWRAFIRHWNVNVYVIFIAYFETVKINLFFFVVVVWFKFHFFAFLLCCVLEHVWLKEDKSFRALLLFGNVHAFSVCCWWSSFFVLLIINDDLNFLTQHFYRHWLWMDVWMYWLTGLIGCNRSWLFG